MSWCLKFCAVGFLCMFSYVCSVTGRPPIGKIAAHSAYDIFSWYKFLIVNLVFSHLGFWSANLFLIATFPDLCLLVPSSVKKERKCTSLCQSYGYFSHCSCWKDTSISKHPVESHDYWDITES